MNNENNRGILEYEDDLLAALEQARQTADRDGLQDEPYTVTQREAEEVFGLSRLKTKAILNNMCDSGTLKRVMIRRVNNWDVLNSVAGYRFEKVV
jgi:hypothetical protein